MSFAVQLFAVFVFATSSIAKDFCVSDELPTEDGLWVCDQEWLLGARMTAEDLEYGDKWEMFYNLPPLYAVSKIRTIPRCVFNDSIPLVLRLTLYAWDESSDLDFDMDSEGSWINIEIKTLRFLSNDIPEYGGFAYRTPYWKLVLDVIGVEEQCLPDFAFFARAGVAAMPGYRMHLDMPVFKSATKHFFSPLSAAPVTDTCDTVRAVPADVVRRYKLDRSFYRKYTSAYNIPVMGSSVLDDRALQRACYVVRFMLADRKDIRDHMYNNKGRVAIIGRRETVPMVPEMRRFTTWTRRAAGGTYHIPVNVGAEENMLCERGDHYARSQDIFMHEFAHGIHLIACFTAIPNFNSDLSRVFYSAKRRGLWRNTYASTDNREYFAEGVQAFFNQQREGRPGGDGIQNHVNTREELREYDPDLYKIIESLFPCGNEYIPRCNDVSQVQSLQQQLRMNCKGGTGQTTTAVTSTITGTSAVTSTITSTSVPSPTPTQPSNCEDRHRYCSYWAKIGECRNNPKYMRRNCRKSCGTCPERTTTTPSPTSGNCENKNRFCSYWAERGECSKNPRYMRSNCAKSCQICTMDYCGDEDDRCTYWVDQCATNPYVAENCRKICKFC